MTISSLWEVLLWMQENDAPKKYQILVENAAKREDGDI